MYVMYLCILCIEKFLFMYSFYLFIYFGNQNAKNFP